MEPRTCTRARERPASVAGIRRRNGEDWRSLALLIAVLVLLLPLLSGNPCEAAEHGFDLIPRWVRPERVVMVKLGAEVDATKKIFLRLTGAAAVKDLPLDSAQVGRRLAEVKIPATMRHGTYKAELVDEKGDVLASGPELRVGATEKPSIIKIIPRVSYASNGRYDFEIIGEHFGNSANEIIVRINDEQVEFKSMHDRRTGDPKSVNTCDKLPCLIWNWRSLRIYGLSIKEEGLHRPLRVSVEVGRLPSDEKPLVLSCVHYSTPKWIAFAVLAIVVVLVYFLSREKAGRYQANGRTYATLAYLFIDPETNTYSLSRLQLILWTAAVVVAYSYLAASQFLVQWNWVLPSVPEGLPTLLGISAATIALSVGATEARGSKGAGPLNPGLGDFMTTGGVFAPERLQFFLWTILGVCAFVSATLAQDPATVTEMAKIPDNFLPLMGVSSLGYLAGKVVRKPGPVIKELVPKPPYNPSASGGPPLSIRIMGEHLSGKAKVTLNGVSLQEGEIALGANEPKDAEFVGELLLTPQKVVPALPGVPAVKVVNRDGQSAEM